jgi:predicted DNA-binding antitoxin AbrB/MazE fold protein
MRQMIEVIYEDNVLKPLIPIDGLRKNERAWIVIYSHSDKPLSEALNETSDADELNLLDLAGKIEFAEGYDYKALREGR